MGTHLETCRVSWTVWELTLEHVGFLQLYGSERMPDDLAV